MNSHGYPFAFVTPEGSPWRRSNFRQRYWRPAWDGVNSDDPTSPEHVPAILPWFTFHETRHSHATWLAEDGIPEVARRARPGHKMKGIARVYDHVTPEMQRQVGDVLEARWIGSLLALKDTERDQLASWFPHLHSVFESPNAKQAGKSATIIAAISPRAHWRLTSPEEEQGR